MNSNGDITATQGAFYRKARRHHWHRFNDLRHLIRRPEWIEAAVHTVLSAPGALTPGVDGKTARDYATPEERQALVQEIRECLSGNLFMPMPMRSLKIPKRKGGYRSIGIATIRDRVIGQLIKLVLEPIFEADFLGCSNGYRPGRGSMDSITDCYRSITARRQWVIRADLKDCFVHIDREKLLRLIRRRVEDEWVVDLIVAFLEAGVLSRRFWSETRDGVPQGFGLSPLLANIYLHQLDERVTKQFGTKEPRGHLQGVAFSVVCKYTRYADDIAIFCDELAPDAFRILDELNIFLDESLGMELSEEETCHIREGFDFLGFNLQWRNSHLHVQASGSSVQRFQQRISDTLSAGNAVEPRQVIITLNQIICSYGVQFRYVQTQHQFHILDRWIRRRFDEWLSARAGNRKGPAIGLAFSRLSDFRHERYQPKCRNPFP